MKRPVEDKSRKQDDRRVLHPLIEELRRRTVGQTYTEFARVADVESYTPSRLLGSQSIASPSYVMMTQIIVAAGLTPNQAAKLIGLYTPTEQEEKAMLTEDDDPRLVDVVRTALSPTLHPEVRESFINTIASFAAIARGETLVVKK